MGTETWNIATEVLLGGAILLAGLFALAAILYALHDAWQQGERRKAAAREKKRWQEAGAVYRRDADD